ncbi:MAG: GNAT family N-acetyltransferase [Lachnospiraceae bacterium]|nr:GNAT family N-acetyltransferase [Lachnospiraceae bacterium]
MTEHEGLLIIPAAFSHGYRIRTAFPGDAVDILKIMDTTVKNLEDRSLFIPDTLSMIRETLTSEGFGLLALDFRDKPVAYLLVLYPRLNKVNLGYDFTFIKEELMRVAHIESVAVLPEHRGHNLQQSLITRAEQLLTASHPYHMATVSPKNQASLKSFEACGYRILDTREKYGNHLRHILFKSIEKKQG